MNIHRDRTNGVRRNQLESRNFALANQTRLSDITVQAAAVYRSSEDEFTVGIGMRERRCLCLI